MLSTMTGKELKAVILFMANRWDKNTAIQIFGENLGTHFWSKWRGTAERYNDPDYATMRLFYEMTTNNLDILCKHIEANYMDVF